MSSLRNSVLGPASTGLGTWLLGAAVLAIGCSSEPTAPAADTGADAGAEVLVTDSAPPVTPDAAACTLTKPYSSKDKVCNDCAQARCCAEVNGCLGDPRCDDDYVNCILACALTGPSDGGDAGAEMAACLSDCATRYPVGKAAYDAAIGCVDSKCADVCK